MCCELFRQTQNLDLCTMCTVHPGVESYAISTDAPFFFFKNGVSNLVMQLKFDKVGGASKVQSGII